MSAAAVQAVVGLGVQFLLMRLLAPDAFGTFALVLAGAALAQTLLTLRLNIIIFRLPQADMTPERQDELYSALCWESILATAVTFIWVAFSGLMSPWAFALAVSLGISHWTSQAVTFYERGMPYRRLASIETGSQIIGHAVAATLALGGAGAIALYARELAATLSRLAMLIATGAIHLRKPRRLGLREWQGLIRESRGNWADGIIDGGFNRLVILASGWAGGISGAGVFAQSQRLALIPHQFLSPISSRLAANIFSRIPHMPERRRMLARLLMAATILLGVSALIMVILAEPIIPRLLGEHWRPAADTLVAMAGVVVCFTVLDMTRTFCYTQCLTRLVLWARGIQYGVFLAGLPLALGSEKPVLVLAWTLSASFAGATIMLVVMTFRAARRRSV